MSPRPPPERPGPAPEAKLNPIGGKARPSSTPQTDQDLTSFKPRAWLEIGDHRRPPKCLSERPGAAPEAKLTSIGGQSTPKTNQDLSSFKPRAWLDIGDHKCSPKCSLGRPGPAPDGKLTPLAAKFTKNRPQSLSKPNQFQATRVGSSYERLRVRSGGE